MYRWRHVLSKPYAGLMTLLFLASSLLFTSCVSMKAYKELEYERDRALDEKRSAEESLRTFREEERGKTIQYKSQIQTIQNQEDEIATLKKKLEEIKEKENNNPAVAPVKKTNIYYSRSKQVKGTSGLEINQETGGLVLKQTMLFHGSELKLQSEAQAILTGVAEALKRPSLADHVVYIDGHTNSTKVTIRKHLYPDNWALGARRASQVSYFLKSKGISPARLVVRSYGYSIPLHPGAPKNPDNRRVEIIIGDTISSVR